MPAGTTARSGRRRPARTDAQPGDTLRGFGAYVKPSWRGGGDQLVGDIANGIGAEAEVGGPQADQLVDVRVGEWGAGDRAGSILLGGGAIDLDLNPNRTGCFVGDLQLSGSSLKLHGCE